VDTITTIEPVAAKWRAFGWAAVELDGHDVDAVAAALADGTEGTGGTDGADGMNGADGAGTAAGYARPRILVCRTSTRHGLSCLPPDADGHFIKLPADLAAAAEAELSAELAHDG
jgi:transketolase